MADYRALADVSESLVRVIWQEIVEDADLFALIGDPTLISLDSPAELEDNAQALLSVYLYQVTEDVHARNRPPGPGTGGRLRRAPLALDLSFLITPLLRAARDRQIVLGKVMQVLSDRSSLEGNDLTGSLGPADSPMRVVINPWTIDEAGRLWGAIGAKYRLSLSYSVRVTLLDSTRERLDQPVVERESGYAGRVGRAQAVV